MSIQFGGGSIDSCIPCNVFERELSGKSGSMECTRRACTYQK